MTVKIISYTQSNVNVMFTLEDIIAYCCRVSNPGNQMTNMNNTRLMKYLYDNNHWSPFEMVNICLEITTTRDISRQILRHRSFTFQEFSQRYAKVDDSFIVRDTRMQDNKNRQNSIETDNINLITEWNERQKQTIEIIKENYEWALNNGIAKEQARVILPEGNTSTKLYMNGSLRSWIHYLELRLGNGTQKEHREVAYACYREIKSIFPLIEIFINA